MQTLQLDPGPSGIMKHVSYGGSRKRQREKIERHHLAGKTLLLANRQCFNVAASQNVNLRLLCTLILKSLNNFQERNVTLILIFFVIILIEPCWLAE